MMSRIPIARAVSICLVSLPLLGGCEAQATPDPGAAGLVTADTLDPGGPAATYLRFHAALQTAETFDDIAAFMPPEDPTDLLMALIYQAVREDPAGVGEFLDGMRQELPSPLGIVSESIGHLGATVGVQATKDGEDGVYYVVMVLVEDAWRWSLDVRWEPGLPVGHSGPDLDDATPAASAWVPIVREPGFRWDAIEFVDSQRGFAAVKSMHRSGGLYRTEDAGRSWTRVEHPEFGPMFGLAARDSRAIWAFGYHREPDDDPDALHIQGEMLAASNDGGRTWKVILERGPDMTTSMGPAFLVDEHNGWIIDQDVLIRTRDGGATWSRTRPMPGRVLTSVYFLDSRRGWVTGGVPGEGGTSRGFILETVDGGATFTPRVEDAAGRLMSITWDDQGRGWAVGSSVVLRSRDGIDWDVVDLNPELPSDHIGFRGQRGWRFGPFGVAISSDGGETWVHEKFGREIWIKDVTFVDEDHGWMTAAEAGTVYQYRAR